MWTAFGPTNVDIHRVATAGELGDMQVAADLGPRIGTSRLPTERRTRHNIQVARALSARNRIDDARAMILEAESWAPVSSCSRGYAISAADRAGPWPISPIGCTWCRCGP
jgi:hypothetical protein